MLAFYLFHFDRLQQDLRQPLSTPPIAHCLPPSVYVPTVRRCATTTSFDDAAFVHFVSGAAVVDCKTDPLVSALGGVVAYTIVLLRA